MSLSKHSVLEKSKEKDKCRSIMIPIFGSIQYYRYIYSTSMKSFWIYLESLIINSITIQSYSISYYHIGSVRYRIHYLLWYMTSSVIVKSKLASESTCYYLIQSGRHWRHCGVESIWDSKPRRWLRWPHFAVSGSQCNSFSCSRVATSIHFAFAKRSMHTGH